MAVETVIRILIVFFGLGFLAVSVLTDVGIFTKSVCVMMVMLLFTWAFILPGNLSSVK